MCGLKWERVLCFAGGFRSRGRIRRCRGICKRKWDSRGDVGCSFIEWNKLAYRYKSFTVAILFNSSCM